MAERPITIHSTCVTTPDQHVHVKVGDNVRWHADHTAIYILQIPGGFFQGHPDDFPILVVSDNWTKNYVVAGKAGSTIVNYIHDASGSNCLNIAADGPPDIIIDATLGKGKKSTVKRKK